ncbi:MAG TPA: alpha/beta fold hydrolase, partial [Rhodocyclaceae bacterium]|nr:alpha/beta fold hydrolase [Rhodocyclaceae bacterium]
MHGRLEAVVLVHGLWMRGIVFALQRRRLARRGFAVHAFSYPSMRGTLAANARALAAFVAGVAGTRVHLVGHSLGGVIALVLIPALAVVGLVAASGGVALALLLPAV